MACSIVMLSAAWMGCGASGFLGDAGFDVGHRDGFDALSMDAGSNCLAPGTAQFQVSVEIVPGLEVQRSDVWIAAMCVVGGEERVVRVVAADASGGPSTLAGLGAGTYVIRAGAFIAPGTASPPLQLSAGGTNVTTLTLAPGPSPIAILRANFPESGIDAGVVDSGISDASVSDASMPDAAPMQGTMLSAEIPSPDMTSTLGSLRAYLQPRDATSFDVRLEVLANDCGAGCGPIMVDSAEIRTETAGTPRGMAVAPFATRTVLPGTSVMAPTVTLPGSLTDPAGMQLAIAVFPAVPVDNDGGAALHDP